MARPQRRVEPHPATAGATLTVDLAALRDNYLSLKAKASGALCAAVVKGDGYGIGVTEAATTLAAAGCDTFFVAHLSEALTLRPTHPAATIYVLNGLPPDAAPDFERHNLRPVLGCLSELEEWAAHCRSRGARLPAALHLDTGINRLGLDADEFERLVAAPEILETFTASLVMSHLACADEAEDPMNARQLERFKALRRKLPLNAPASLANSAGILNGADYHFDLVRPGVALYGGQATSDAASRLKPVVHLSGRIMQTRTVEAGQSVGYGATWTAQRRSRIAVVGVGYADGYIRLLGAPTGEDRASVYVGGVRAPVVGRVSMDMITIDVTDVPPSAADRGSAVELLGHNVGVDDLARSAQTIGYEILTSLGSRYARVYSGG